MTYMYIQYKYLFRIYTFLKRAPKKIWPSLSVCKNDFINVTGRTYLKDLFILAP